MIRLIVVLAVAVATALAGHGHAETTPSLSPRSHPYLFLNAQNFQQIKQKARRHPWAKRELHKLLTAADAATSRPLQIPELPGEWYHHYVCKDCGIQLTEKGKLHLCGRCGRQYTGWPYDGVVAARIHGEYADDAQTLGLAYQLTGDTRYADHSRQILLAYANRYSDFPIHDTRGKQSKSGARVTAQTLNEAINMISLAWAYDLIHDAPGTTPQHRQAIVNDLLRPAADVIRRYDAGISNWQSWHNAAIAAIGYAINDPEMISHSIDGPSGIRFQLEKSILPDGFWYEGAAAYHFYALHALQLQAMAMKQAGTDIISNPRFRSIYEAPLGYTFPNGRFPAVNDSNPLPIWSQAARYEVAYSWFGDPAFAAVAKRASRQSLDALLWGKEELHGDLAAVPSRNFPALGAIMLRQNASTSNPLALHLDYGPHGGGHGHYDKLGIIFFANGHDAMPDPGRLAYGAPLHNQWYRTTLAHNTVIVDGQNQKPAEGRLVSSSLDGHIKFATAACDTAYDDVTITRSLALAPDYLLDVVSGVSTGTHTWDLAYHVYGKPETADLPLQPVSLQQNKNGYNILQNLRACTIGSNDPKTTTAPSHRLTFTQPEHNQQLNLTHADTGPAQVILADGVSGAGVTTCSVVLLRKEGKSPLWITVAAPGDPDHVQLTATTRQGNYHISVTTPRGTDSYILTSGELAPSARY